MLSIRTQNRLCIVPFNKPIITVEIQDGKEYRIQNENGGILGTYATKERAIQVLDEIEALLSKEKQLELYAIIDAHNGRYSSARDRVMDIKQVYQMPIE